jgi:hypothetical protein
MWFEEGLAEFMGAVEVDRDKVEYLKDAKVWHNRILIDRIAEVRGESSQAYRQRRDLAERWTIKEFLLPNDNGELIRAGDKLLPGNGAAMASFFYVRSWAFTHFLWFYDNGKYREKLLTYLDDVMKGTQSAEKFAKIMGRPIKDFGPIEMEYEWYWNKLLQRKTEENAVTKQRPTPKTDPPTGRVEDDPEWIDVYNDNRKAKDKDKK